VDLVYGVSVIFHELFFKLRRNVASFVLGRVCSLLYLLGLPNNQDNWSFLFFYGDFIVDIDYGLFEDSKKILVTLTCIGIDNLR
jgi:hypothetical protein